MCSNSDCIITIRFIVNLCTQLIIIYFCRSINHSSFTSKSTYLHFACFLLRISIFVKRESSRLAVDNALFVIQTRKCLSSKTISTNRHHSIRLIELVKVMVYFCEFFFLTQQHIKQKCCREKICVPNRTSLFTSTLS